MIFLVLGSFVAFERRLHKNHISLKHLPLTVKGLIMKQKISIHNLKRISHLTSKRYHFKEKISTANENQFPDFFGDVIKSNLSMRRVAWIRRHSSLGSHMSGCKKANNFLTLTFKGGC